MINASCRYAYEALFFNQKYNKMKNIIVISGHPDIDNSTANKTIIDVLENENKSFCYGNLN